MAAPLYPIKEIKGFSDLLVHFERGLSQIANKETNFSIQLRDLPIFRRIKQKIEQLPFMKEIFSLNSRTSHYVLKSRKGLTSTESHMVSIDVSSFGNLGGSGDWSKGSPTKMPLTSYSSILGKTGTRLPPVSSQPFISDGSRDLPASQVSISVKEAISVTKEALDMFKKFKIAIFNSACHRVETSKSIVEYLFFILMGSKHNKLAVCTLKPEQVSMGSSTPSPKKQNFKLEEEYSRQFNIQGEKMKVIRAKPEDLQLIGIDRALAEGIYMIKRLRIRSARPWNSYHATGNPFS
jgi:hypothetical protein